MIRWWDSVTYGKDSATYALMAVAIDWFKHSKATYFRDEGAGHRRIKKSCLSQVRTNRTESKVEKPQWRNSRGGSAQSGAANSTQPDTQSYQLGTQPIQSDSSSELTDPGAEQRRQGRI